LLYLSAYFEKHRTEYTDLLLRVSQRRTGTPGLEFFLTGVAEQAMDGVRTRHKVMALWQDYRKRLQTARASILGQNLVDQLFMQPAMSVGLARQFLRVSFLSAQNNVMRLVKLGILQRDDRAEAQSDFNRAEILQLTGARISNNESSFLFRRARRGGVQTRANSDAASRPHDQTSGLPQRPRPRRSHLRVVRAGTGN